LPVRHDVMTAIRQLWQRAPLWRAVVLTACTSTALAAIYGDGLRRQQPVSQASSSYTPAVNSPSAAVPPAAAPGSAAVAFGQSFRGTVPFIGRSLPLPVGDWMVVGINQAKLPSGQLVGAIMLTRADAGQLLGAVVAFASDGSGPAAGSPADYTCQGPRVLTARIFAAEDHGRQDNWCIDAYPAILWDGVQQPTVLRAGLGALRQTGVAVPSLMLRSYFIEADKASYLKVNYFLSMQLGGIPVPTSRDQNLWTLAGLGQSPERMAFFVRVGNWTARWHTLIKRAFTHEIKPLEVTADLADVH
jgi:hypothetical protein